MHLRDAHARLHSHTKTSTHTHMHMDHAPRHSSHADTVAVPLWHKNQAWHAIWSWEEGLLEGCWNRVVHASTVRLTIWLGILCISNFEHSCKREEEGRWMDGDREVDSCRVKSSQSTVAPSWWMYSVLALSLSLFSLLHLCWESKVVSFAGTQWAHSVLIEIK